MRLAPYLSYALIIRNERRTSDLESVVHKVVLSLHFAYFQLVQFYPLYTFMPVVVKM